MPLLESIARPKPARRMIEVFTHTYWVNIRPSHCVVTRNDQRTCVVDLDNVQHFLDSHRVGVFESTMTHSGV
jgi:hypothetical protein